LLQAILQRLQKSKLLCLGISTIKNGKFLPNFSNDFASMHLRAAFVKNWAFSKLTLFGTGIRSPETRHHLSSPLGSAWPSPPPTSANVFLPSFHSAAKAFCHVLAGNAAAACALELLNSDGWVSWVDAKTQKGITQKVLVGLTGITKKLSRKERRRKYVSLNRNHSKVKTQKGKKNRNHSERKDSDSFLAPTGITRKRKTQKGKTLNGIWPQPKSLRKKRLSKERQTGITQKGKTRIDFWPQPERLKKERRSRDRATYRVKVNIDLKHGPQGPANM
jgi:hypothetical protein